MVVGEFKPGLEGVPATLSSISFVDGQKGVLEYRGISIEELALKSSFVETAYLLIWGVLPTKEELEAFEHEIRYHRRIKYRIRNPIRCWLIFLMLVWLSTRNIPSMLLHFRQWWQLRRWQTLMG